METLYIASYDFGTSAVKIALVDFGGCVAATATAGYSLITPHTNWAEQNPDDYWTAVCGVTQQVLHKNGVKAAQVKGVVFSTQWKGIIPVDAQGNVLNNNITWLDGRAGKQAEKINSLLGFPALCNKDYWAKLLWVKENLPEVYENTQTFLEVNAFLKFKSTGVKAVDLTNDFIHAPNAATQALYSRILEAAELDQGKFPPMVFPSDKVGGLTSKAAAELGLAEDTPVFGGCGDIPAISIGAGCNKIGTAHMYLGSSGWVGVTMNALDIKVDRPCMPIDGTKVLFASGLQSICMTFNWATKQFYHAEKQLLGDGIFKFVDKDIADIPPGSLNLIATPWIHGERPPLTQTAKAVFFNISNLHDRRHFVHAIMEGVCLHLRWKGEEYTKATGQAITSYNVVGGGACSAPWMQIMANVMQVPIHVPCHNTHAGAIGAAFCAMVGLGLCENFEAADELIAIEKTYMPDSHFAATYDKLYLVFKDLFPTLKAAYDTLNS